MEFAAVQALQGAAQSIQQFATVFWMDALQDIHRAWRRVVRLHVGECLELVVPVQAATCLVVFPDADRGDLVGQADALLGLAQGMQCGDALACGADPLGEFSDQRDVARGPVARLVAGEQQEQRTRCLLGQGQRRQQQGLAAETGAERGGCGVPSRLEATDPPGAQPRSRVEPAERVPAKAVAGIRRVPLFGQYQRIVTVQVAEGDTVAVGQPSEASIEHAAQVDVLAAGLQAVADVQQ